MSIGKNVQVNSCVYNSKDKEFSKDIKGEAAALFVMAQDLVTLRKSQSGGRIENRTGVFTRSPRIILL